MGLDETLVAWTDSFMRDRRIIMSVDGQHGEAVSVTTGLPQGSAILPVLFAIYSLKFMKRWRARWDSRGMSFVDDATWVVERTSARLCADSTAV